MLEQRYDESGNTVYSFSNVRKGIKTRLHEVRQLSLREIAWRRYEYQQKARVHWYELSCVDRKINKINHLSKNKFVRDLANRGRLSDSFAPEVVEDACNGFSPDNFDLHHVVPIALGGQDNLRNMILIHKAAHKPFLHGRVFDMLHRRIKPRGADEVIPNGEKVFVEIPDFPYVVTEQVMRMIFTDYTDYEDERDRQLAALTEETLKVDSEAKIPKSIAKLVKDMRECGKLPPDPTKGAPTVRLVKSGRRPAIKCLGRQR